MLRSLPSAQRTGSVLVGAIAAATFGSLVTAADPLLPPVIHDWHIRYTIPQTLDIIPTPHPGWDLPASHPTYVALYAALAQAGLPVGLMLNNGTAPLTGWKDPNALQTTMGLVQQLDYVFGDFEAEVPELEIINLIFTVRFHENPMIANAWIGVYNQYPGTPDMSALSEATIHRGFASGVYNYGLDVAMPATYPFSAYQTHTMPQFWGSNLAPNVRSALFWAPLEKLQTAKNALPSWHKLIAWMAPYVDDATFSPPAPVPPIPDNIALLQHFRLRGADGYYVLESFVPGYTTAQYRLDMNNAWHALSPIFDRTGPITILNTTTDKQSGVQWSGVTRDGATAVLVSNLGNADVEFTLPTPAWPDGSVVKSLKGTHQLHFVMPEIPSEPDPLPIRGDLDGDGIVGLEDMLIVIAAFGHCPVDETCPADLNVDGVVDLQDLFVLRQLQAATAGG